VAETGIRVTYDVYDSNEVLEAKLLSGRSGYDVVVPSASPFMARQIAAGVYRVLDRDKLPNWKNLDPRILEVVAASDPGNAHGVPYLWSFTGIGANETQLRAALGETTPEDSLALVFNPAFAAKLAPCGISLLDTPQEVFPAALAYLGLDPKSRDLGDLDKAVAALDKVRPYSASSTPRNTSTISPMATCAWRWAIPAMWCRRASGRARPGTVSRSAFESRKNGCRWRSTCWGSRPMRRIPRMRCASSTTSCARR
jgi:spermidine/putrescine-binding protein